MAGLSFVTLLSYDYRYSYNAIRSYYGIADEILLAVDADRLTWARKPFDIDMDEVRAFVAHVDEAKKIRIVEGNFHGAERPMANDTEERSVLSRQCREGNWVVQIDADEMLINPGDFRQWLLDKNPAQCSVFATWITVFKTFGSQVLVIDPPTETTPVATMARGEYVQARETRQTSRALSPLQLLHLSWGRSSAEVLQKLTNWSHSEDFDVQAFYRLWESVTLENYSAVRDFHPMSGATWKSLALATLELPK